MKTMRDAFVHTASEWLDRDPQTALVLADIGVGRFEALGVHTRHPDRMINVGIREALAIGAAAGFALEGFVPIVHTYAPFLVERAFEQIKLDFVHQGLRGILVSIGGSYDASAEGRTHQAPADVALFDTLADVRVELPGHPAEVPTALARARGHAGVSYVRLSTEENAAPRDEGIAVVREGRRGTVLVIGPLLDPVLKATELLDVRVLYTSTARPLDPKLAELVPPGTPLALVEPVLEGTSVNAVLALTQPSAIFPIGVGRRDLRRYGTPGQHAAAHGLDAVGLRDRLTEWCISVDRRSPPVSRSANGSHFGSLTRL